MTKHDHLQTYLHDHLAGAALAIDLLKALAGRPDEHGLDAFAHELLGEILEDHEQLKTLSSHVETHSAGFKEIVARTLEKFSRLKFHQPGSKALGNFEALETLALGILGKQALWTALSLVEDPRLKGLDFATLIRRARDQHERVEQRRLELAPSALSEGSD